MEAEAESVPTEGHPPGPPGPPGRPLDNEPTPLLTYDESAADDEPLGPTQPQRSGGRRRWTLAPLLIALLAGGGYIAFEVTAAESLELTPLPTMGLPEPMASSGTALVPVTATDTVVLPGTGVEIAVPTRVVSGG